MFNFDSTTSRKAMDTMANKKQASAKKKTTKSSPMKKVQTRAQIAPRKSGNRNGRGRA